MKGTAATPSLGKKLKPPSSVNTKPCAHCGESFTYKRKNAMFCGNTCRAASNYSKKVGEGQKACEGYVNHSCPDSKLTSAKAGRCRECKKKQDCFNRYPNSVLGGQVIRTAKRAGTIETYPSVQAIAEFEVLCKLRSQYNSIRDGKFKKEFSVCHKVPLNHPDRVGLTCGDNLFVGLTKVNQKAGQECGFHEENRSLYIPRSSLNPDYLVTGDHAQADIMKLLCRRFGDEFLRHVFDANHLARNTRDKLPDDFVKYGESIPNVIGVSLMDQLGHDQYNEFSQVFEWACYESGAMVITANGEHREGAITDNRPWEQVQNYLQTDDVFCCEGFVFGYEPKYKPPEDDDW